MNIFRRLANLWKLSGEIFIVKGKDGLIFETKTKKKLFRKNMAAIIQSKEILDEIEL